MSSSAKRDARFSEDWQITFFCQRGQPCSSLCLPEWRRSGDFLQILKVPICKVPVCELLKRFCPLVVALYFSLIGGSDKRLLVSVAAPDPRCAVDAVETTKLGRVESW